MTTQPDPYGHLDDRQRRIADRMEAEAGATGTDLTTILDSAGLSNRDKADLARVWGGDEAAAQYRPSDIDEY